jgi:hypothetical protein
MRKWLILLSALSGTTASSAPAWTWVDANGTVHYSDRPVPGARQVELAGAQAFGSQAPAAATPARTTATDSQAAAPYRVVDIVSPADQETLWNLEGTLSVQVRFQPSLQPGHRYDLVLDGERRNINTATSRASLSDVFRGTHSLEVVVIDAAGTELMRSPSRTFFVQQTSVQNPNSVIGRQRPGGN